jgi:isoleucyl-tRNA synthetase
MKDIMAATRSGNVEIRDDGSLVAAGEIIAPDEFELRINAEEGHACMSDGGLFACLDLTLNRDLELEGLARDVVRVVQNARREADLIPDERIILGITASGDLREAIGRHEAFIRNETLAVEIVYGDIETPCYSEKADIQGDELGLMVGRTA